MTLTQEEKDAILKGLEDGLYPRQIMKKYPELNLNKRRIEYIRTILMEDDETKDRIQRAREIRRNAEEDRKQKEKDRKQKEKGLKRKQEEVVLEGYSLGLSQKEIMEGNSELNLDIERIKSIVKKIISKDKELEEKFRQAKEKRRNEEREKQQKEREKQQKEREKQQKDKNIKWILEQEQICYYFNKQYSTKKISELMGKSYNSIFKRISKLKEQGLIGQANVEIEQEKTIGIVELKEIKRQLFEIKIIQKIDLREEKLKRYIDLCNIVYKDKKMPKLELQLLKSAILIVSIDDNDIINFIKHCTNIGEYGEALDLLSNIRKMKQISISEGKEEKISKMRDILIRANKIQQAKQLLEQQDINLGVISQNTGLSKEEVSFLKIKLSSEPIKLLGIKQREKVIKLLLQGYRTVIIQQKMGISDFEMQDIEEQVIFRERLIQYEEQEDVNKKVDIETQVKQDSYIRIIVLLTKLGKSKRVISNILKMEESTIEEKINLALKYGMIRESQLGGISILESPDKEIQEMSKVLEM